MPTLYESLSKDIAKQDENSRDAYLVLVDALLEGTAGITGELIRLGPAGYTSNFYDAYALVKRNKYIVFLGVLGVPTPTGIGTFIVNKRFNVGDELKRYKVPYMSERYPSKEWSSQIGEPKISHINTDSITTDIGRCSARHGLSGVWIHYFIASNHAPSRPYCVNGCWNQYQHRDICQDCAAPLIQP